MIQLARAVQPVTPAFAGVVDEGFRGFLDDDTHRARLRIDRADAIELMAALVVVEVEYAAVRCPHRVEFAAFGEGILVEITRHANLRSIALFDHPLRLRQWIAGLDVVDNLHLRLHAVVWHRFDDRHLSALYLVRFGEDDA